MDYLAFIRAAMAPELAPFGLSSEADLISARRKGFVSVHMRGKRRVLLRLHDAASPPYISVPERFKTAFALLPVKGKGEFVRLPVEDGEEFKNALRELAYQYLMNRPGEYKCGYHHAACRAAGICLAGASHDNKGLPCRQMLQEAHRKRQKAKEKEEAEKRAKAAKQEEAAETR